jgi:hypothetical protein
MLWNRKPKPARPVLAFDTGELRDTARSLTGWTVRGSRGPDPDSLLFRAADEIDRLERLVADGVEAFRLTREYLGEDALPAVEGWAWFDWTERARPLELAAT